jgi:hypothetical protein
VIAVVMAGMVLAGGMCAGQTLPGMPAAQAVPAVPLVGPVTAAPEVVALLKVLRDRKDTLKDFVAKIDYSVEDSRGDVTGKLGTVAYLEDAALGPIFSAEFDKRTTDGKPVGLYSVWFIFDGKDLTIKDMGMDGKGRTYVRSTMLPPGAKPGDAVTLSGALPLPIGLDVDDVLRTFEVTLLANDAALGVLKLVPRDAKKFEYKQLNVTVDRKTQLPVTLVQTAKDDTVTTIKMTELQINKGLAKMLDASTPAAAGWVPKGGGP